MNSPLGHSDGAPPPSADYLNRHQTERHSASKNARGDENFNYFLDREALELLSRAKAQKEEILLLREQVVEASNRELQLLNEKHVLDRKISDLRMVYH